MEVIVIGIVTAFNFIVIKKKLERKRFADAGLDLLALVLLSMMFGGTVSGMVVAMIASLLISIYLLTNPPNLVSDDELLQTLRRKFDAKTYRRY
jgi:hypothetical protein